MIVYCHALQGNIHNYVCVSRHHKQCMSCTTMDSTCILATGVRHALSRAICQIGVRYAVYFNVMQYKSVKLLSAHKSHVREISLFTGARQALLLMWLGKCNIVSELMHCIKHLLAKVFYCRNLSCY